MRSRLVVPALVVLVAACSDGSSSIGDATAPSSSTSSSTVAPPYAVTDVTREYVDDARPSRRLVTTVRVPDGPGPFPLVVLAHGNSGHPRKMTQLIDAWARAGYVVAAPAFPLTNDDVDPTVIADYVEQPADLSTVIDGLLADSAADAGPLSGSIDPDRIGVAGHSLGGGTAYGLVANTCCRDDRVDAVVAFSTLRFPFSDGVDEPSELPLLAVHGTADTALRYENGRAAYEMWAGPKWFLTLEGGPHSTPYENETSPWDPLVLETTTLFWDAELRDDEDAAQALGDYTPPPDLARIESVS